METIKDKTTPIESVVHETMEALEKLYMAQDQRQPIMTGIPGIDRMLQGLHKGELHVIASPNRQQNTMIAYQVIEFVAGQIKKPVGFFSTKQKSCQDIVQDYLLTKAGISIERIKENCITPQERLRMEQTASEMAKLPLHIACGENILEQARQLASEQDIALFVVDDFQLALSCAVFRAPYSALFETYKKVAVEVRTPLLFLTTTPTRSYLCFDAQTRKFRWPKLQEIVEVVDSLSLATVPCDAPPQEAPNVVDFNWIHIEAPGDDLTNFNADISEVLVNRRGGKASNL